MLDALADAVARHSGGWWSDTAVPRLTLVRLDGPMEPTDLLYEPMVCFVARGAKRTVAGDHYRLAGPGTMLFSSIEVPVTATFEQVPYRSAVLRLDRRVLAGLLLDLDGPGPERPDPGGLVTAPMSAELIDAVTRWVRLLDTPDDIGALAGRTEGEILYRLLLSPIGPLLRQFALPDSRLDQVRGAAGWLRRHYAEPVSVEQVAGVAHMSTATLHRHFKAATGMSPLQFQKRLRLQEARRLLAAGGLTVTLVAEKVGYASPTQFNREYRNSYGIPPARDAARLRGQ